MYLNGYSTDCYYGDIKELKESDFSVVSVVSLPVSVFIEVCVH